MLSQLSRRALNNKRIRRYISSINRIRNVNDGVNAGEIHEEQYVEIEKDSNITLIGINRPKYRNAITTGLAKQLDEAFRQFAVDEESSIAVLYGMGGTLCAGHDLVELEAQTAQQQNLDFVFNPECWGGPSRHVLRKPVVCAINGYCVASGLELALMCDLRVMEDSAVLGFFNRRFGVPLSEGGAKRLATAIGFSRALDLISTGRRIHSAEALNIGLINRRVATGTALGQAVNLAFSIAKFPQASLLHDRHVLFTNAFKAKDFSVAIKNETMSISREMIQQIHEGTQRFANSKNKGAKTHSWQLKEKPIADWELAEIAHEEAYAKLKKL